MIRSLLFSLFFVFAQFGITAQVKVILDTDPSADPDDVGCMAMLHNLASMGECEILGMINSTHYKQSSLSISAINQFYQRPAIPIGDYRGYAEKIEAPSTNYDYHLARVYPRSLRSWKDAQGGVALYREILASAEKQSITILIIGTMHNFYGLLQSEGDEFSPLDGKALVKEKVARVVTMGGNFIEGQGYDRTNWGGSELLCSYTEWSCINEERNRMCRYVIENCPSPFIASGWEVGCGDYHEAAQGNVITGQKLLELDSAHVLRRSYEYHFQARGETENISRHSNDQCALHFAIRGERNNYTLFGDGMIRLTEAGECVWDQKQDREQGYIQKARDKDLIAEEIEALMMMEIPPVDMSPPTIPQNLSIQQNDQRLRLNWDASEDDTKGSWVVAYRIFGNDQLLATAYGRQAFLSIELADVEALEVRAVNASGIESESSWVELP